MSSLKHDDRHSAPLSALRAAHKPCRRRNQYLSTVTGPRVRLTILKPPSSDQAETHSDPDGGPDNQRFYVPQLDGLRFLAALFVFFYHAPQLPGLA